MTTFALGLVLASAIAHATWNYLAKRAGGGVPFVWLAVTASVPLYAPAAIAVFVLTGASVGGVELLWIAGNAVLNVAYFIVLQRGYRAAPLSVVYPLARGSGPLLATLGAVLILGERPTAISIAGAVAIVIGILVLAGDPRDLRRRGRGGAVGYALATGAIIAAYTLWDKRGVGALAIPPLVYWWSSNLLQSVMLGIVAAPRWPEVRAVWSAHGRAALGVALLAPLAYVLILTALAISPVSVIAPAREVGILFGVVLGGRLLGEGETVRRGIAAMLMVAGIVALATG